jgi:hypothetical protein
MQVSNSNDKTRNMDLQTVPRGESVLIARASHSKAHEYMPSDVHEEPQVLGMLLPPGAGQGGVPLQTLFGFERVHVKKGEVCNTV